MENLRDLIVFAHGGLGDLPEMDEMMFLFPTIPAMLMATVVLATVLRNRGLLGEPDRVVSLTATAAAVAATLSLGSAAIHFAVIQEHITYDLGFGLFFIGIAWFQAIWAQVYLLRRDRWIAAASLVVNVAVVAVWLVSRTTGLPFGPAPWVPEPIGPLDLFATGFEIALITVLLPAVLPRRWPTFATDRMSFERAFVLATFSIVTVTLLASYAFLATPEVEEAVEATAGVVFLR
jgi:hypothetical protein